MHQWVTMALRNIIKNRRRSFVTLAAIAMGFAAISLFRGYTANTYEGLRQSAIRGEGLGHLTIYKSGWLEHGSIDPQPYLFRPAELLKIKKLVEGEDEVILATPQLHIAGLVSNGRSSAIFLAKGVVPSHHQTIVGAMANLRPITGKGLDADTPYQVLVANDLAKQLQLPPGSDAVVMASTLDGQMNALDVTVSGNYDTGSDATNDKYMLFSLEYAQQLYDTEDVDRIIVLLDDWRNTWRVRQRFEDMFQQVGLDCQIKTWDELSVFFTKVKNMFDIIFLFLFTIVLVIVVMSTVNTMGMAVLERTREIGTLRALGLKRRGVNLLFGIEGSLLGSIGSILGMVLNTAGWLFIRLIGPTYTPPGVSTPVPLVVDLIPGEMMMLMGFLMVLSLLAAILPARQAARKNVVAALGHI
jgi:putative ABC transport system permease protein